MSSPQSGDVARGDEPLVIACAYPEGMLSSSWYRAYRRVKQTMKRGAFNALVELVPMTALPARVDVLVVPPSLEDEANATAGVQERLVSSPEGVQRAFDRLVERLVLDGRLQHAPTPGRALAVHRGFQALGDRARLAD
jgi:hypothetical protein